MEELAAEDQCHELWLIMVELLMSVSSLLFPFCYPAVSVV